MATMKVDGFMIKFPLAACDPFGKVTSPIGENFTFSLNIKTSSTIASIVAEDCEVKLNHESAMVTASNLPIDKSAIIIEVKTSSYHPIAALKAGRFTAISIFPSFETKTVSNNEFTFIIDCSGSMCDRIDTAKKCLNTLVHSLPLRCQFSLIAFGADFKVILPTCEYNDDNLKLSVDLIEKLDADMGGTDLYRLLKHVLDQPPKTGFMRQIFVITDGETKDSDKCIAECYLASKLNRIFTIGIWSADPGLIEGMAEAARGESTFVKVEDLEEKVVMLLASSLTDSASGTEIFLNGGDIEKTFPLELPSLYSLSPISILVKSIAPSSDNNIIVTANSMGVPVEYTCEAMVDNEIEDAVKALFAYSSIKEMQYLNIIQDNESLTNSII